MQIDLRVLELLSSKICHDLISPVSAINNGVELIEDIGATVVDEAMKLIADSAAQSSRRLKMFRMAYGRAGSEENLPLEDVRAVALQYFSVGKTTLVWPETEALSFLVPARGAFKTLVNLLVLGEEILAYGGVLSLRLEEEGGGARGCRLTLEGKAAHLSQAFEEALRGETAIEALTPRTIQAYMTGRFAAHFGLVLRPCAPREGAFDLILSLGASEVG